MNEQDRLTQRNPGGISRICHHYEVEDRLCYGCVKRAQCNAAIFERLAAYEDTGLTPEEISDAVGWMSPVCIGCDGKTREGGRTDKCGYLAGNVHKCMKQSKHLADLMRAEEEGRLVILPVPIGTDFLKMTYPESLRLKRNVRPAIQMTGIEWPGGFDVEGFMPLHVFEEELKSGEIVAVEGGNDHA